MKVFLPEDVWNAGFNFRNSGGLKGRALYPRYVHSAAPVPGYTAGQYYTKRVVAPTLVDGSFMFVLFALSPIAAYGLLRPLGWPGFKSLYRPINLRLQRRFNWAAFTAGYGSVFLYNFVNAQLELSTWFSDPADVPGMPTLQTRALALRDVVENASYAPGTLELADAINDPSDELFERIIDTGNAFKMWHITDKDLYQRYEVTQGMDAVYTYEELEAAQKSEAETEVAAKAEAEAEATSATE
ncbi:MAG: hypothetical protein MHM6MM_004397 [Cercozoa sp. M6MM]